MGTIKMNLTKAFLLTFFMFGFSKCGHESEYPKWPMNCSFAIYNENKVWANYYKKTYTTTEKECESECASDTKCGMYSWLMSRSWCFSYQHSVWMWSEEGLPVERMLYSNSSWQTGSKECKAQKISPQCRNFVYHDRFTPASFLITSVLDERHVLTADMCKDLCNVFSECDSVVYDIDTTPEWLGLTVCDLHPSSTSDGDECSFDTDRPCGTYKRDCQVPCGAASMTLSLLLMMYTSLALHLVG